jgi:transketolase
LRVSIEAGTTFGWSEITGDKGLRIGIDRFGASAPGKVLMEHFGFSAEKIIPQILAALG